MFKFYRLFHFIRDEKMVNIKWADLKLSNAFTDGWMDVKAALRIAYNNKKNYPTRQVCLKTQSILSFCLVG
jgi:hypothetical protein